MTGHTRALYPDHVNRFKQTCARARLKPSAAKLADSALEKFLDRLFVQGSGIADTRLAVWGFGFEKAWAMTQRGFPKVHGALKDWRLAAPARERYDLACRRLAEVLAGQR